MKRGALILLLLGLIACRRTEDRATERVVERIIAAQGREAKVQIDRERGSITVDLGGAIVPDGWPTDVPIYPNALRAKVATDPAGSRQLSVTTTDPIKPLAQFYREKLTENGWRLELPDGMHSLHARKGAMELAASFSARGGEKGSRVVIEVQASRGDSNRQGG